MNDPKDLSAHIRSVPAHLTVSNGIPSNGSSDPHRINLHAIGGVSPAAENSGEAQIRAIIKVLLKYRILIVGCVIAALIFSMIYVSLATPVYTAETTIKISTYEPVLSATKIEDVLTQKSREGAYLETQISELRSLSLADKVLQNPALTDQIFPKRTRGFLARLFSSEGDEKAPQQVSGEYHFPVSRLTSYLGKIGITAIRRTNLVKLSATHPDARVAAEISNAHARGYIEWVRQHRVEQQSAGLRFLRTQAEELKSRVADLEREIADYAESHSIVAVNKDENITAQKMAQLNEMLTRASAERIEAEHIYREAHSALSAATAGFDDVSIQTMRSNLVELEAEYGNLSQKFTPSYPRMAQLKSQIESLKSAIEIQRRQVVLGLKAKAKAALEKESVLKEELETQKSRTFELSKSQVQYNILNRELTSSRELLENVLRQIKETSLSVESNASNVSIVDLATIPEYPSAPRKKLTVMFALLGGLLFGLALAYALNYLDNSIRTPEDLIAATNLPSLGVVPSFGLESEGGRLRIVGKGRRSLPVEGQSPPSGKTVLPALPTADLGIPIIYVNNPQSVAAEAYRTIRTGILLSQAGEPPRVMLVSSAQSSEGKTTSTVNLAATLASSGARVVLIDADLRRPSVYKFFALDRDQPGLVDLLTGQADLATVSVVDKIPNVTIIPSGRIPPNPAELLGSVEMARLLDHLRGLFDYVLVDSPPVLPVTDSVILSRYVDGVLLVVKGGATPKKVVRDAAERLRTVGARILGAVLNDVDVTRGDYYYYNRYYSAYYQENESIQPQSRLG
jgi:succinoglycan biosynthesis transport protein ExoP